MPKINSIETERIRLYLLNKHVSLIWLYSFGNIMILFVLLAINRAVSTKWFPNRFDTNQAVHTQKMVRGGNFWILESRGIVLSVAKTKALISFAVTVFAYAH